MNDAASWALCFALGAGFGALIALLWRARRDTVRRAENEAALARARAEMQGVFGELARDSLRDNSEMFLQLARERLGREQQDAAQALREREASIQSLVQPIREALVKTEAQLGAIERERIDSFAVMRTQIESLASGQSLLSRETRNLVTALRRPDVRGQWGEITLRRLVELAGMTARVDFTEQPHQAGPTGAVRPDLIVHMPERRDTIVDVKTPLEAYLAAAEAPDETERGVQLKRHAHIVSARVRELAGKQYWSQFERSPEFVVLFLPGDQFLAAALEENPGLIDEALRQNVMLATPWSLVALLKAVAHGWKQSILADNAEEIRALGEELYKRLAVFGEHLARLGKSLGASVEGFNKAVGSLEQQVLPAARRFPELGLRVSRELEPLEPMAAATRMPRATETAADALSDDGP